MNWLDEMAVFEREILTVAKTVLRNPKLRKRDLLALAMGEMEPVTGGIIVRLDSIGCHICIPATSDKRPAEFAPQTHDNPR